MTKVTSVTPREARRIARGRECDLLDVGCGPGTLAQLMPPGVRYHGGGIAIPEPAPNLIEMDIIEEPVSFWNHSQPGRTFMKASQARLALNIPLISPVLAVDYLSGTLTGTAITLNLGFSHPLRGKVDGGQFSLNIPQPHGTTKTLICQPGSMADWNNATAAIVNQVNEDNNRPASPQGG